MALAAGASGTSVASGGAVGAVASDSYVLWRRGAALVVDTLVVSAISWALAGVDGAGLGTLSPSPLLAWLGYYAAFEWLFGASLGKLYMGLSVVTLDGKRAPWSRIAVRNLFRVIDALPFAYLIGGLCVRLTARQQRVGDRWAGTLVVPVEAAPPLTHLGARLAGLAALVVLVVAGSLAYGYFGRPPVVIQEWAASVTAPDAVRGAVVDVGAREGPAGDGGRVTYRVRYRDVHAERCSGTVSLRWFGFGGGGWRVVGAYTRC